MNNAIRKPINPNEEWPAEHTIYLADTGAGKGSMLRGNPDIPKPSAGGRIICWDSAAAYPGYFYRNWNQFVKALQDALNSGRGFCVGYTGGDAMNMVAEHERWAKLVWESLDGNKRTYIIDEEQSRVHETTGKAVGYSCLLMNESRKYGGVWHGTAQRPQEIPKTLLSQAKTKYFGKCDECDISYLSKWLANPGEVLAFKPGEFMRKQAGVVSRGRYPKVTINRNELKSGAIRVT